MALDINEILDEARAIKASDVHFTVGLPPIVRINGDIKKFATPQELKNQIYSDASWR